MIVEEAIKHKVIRTKNKQLYIYKSSPIAGWYKQGSKEVYISKVQQNIGNSRLILFTQMRDKRIIPKYFSEEIFDDEIKEIIEDEIMSHKED